MTTNKRGFEHVVVVGAGPSGLILALLLANIPNGPKITVIDAASELDKSARATHYSPPAIQVLRRAGVLRRVREQGFVPASLCWRKLDGTRIAGFDRSLLHSLKEEGKDPQAVAAGVADEVAIDGEKPGEEKDLADGDTLTVLPVGELCIIVWEALRDKGVDVQWGKKVVAVGGQNEGDKTAWVDVEVEGQTGTQRIEADYVCGCDGGNSGVRKALFGRDFPGFTWDVQVVATNTYYDFHKFGWEDTNFIINRDHWYMAAKMSSKGLWRVTYGEMGGLTPEQLRERQPKKFEEMLPGHPTPNDYKILNISPYKVHQRCVPKMAVGRVALAADAAHLCNPFGGLGLTGGIVDVGCLYDCLRGIYEGVAGPEILDIYSKVRVQRYQEIVNPTSSANIRRLCATDAETVLENDAVLANIKKAEKDPAMSKELQNFSYKLQYDFTQHYSRPLDQSVAVSG